MKFLSVIFIFIVTISSSVALSADNAVAGGRGKTVVLDIQRAIMMTEMAREKMKALENQKEYSEIHKKAELLRQQLTKKQEELQKEGPAWSADKRNNHLQNMDFMRKDFELVAQKLQAEQQGLMRDLMKSAEPKIKQALDQIIKEQNITIVLEKGATIFSSPSTDITDLLVQKLNSIK
jgi:outer membrane protein